MKEDKNNSLTCTVAPSGTNTGAWSPVAIIDYPAFSATGKTFSLPAEKCAIKMKNGKVFMKAYEGVQGGGIHGIFVQLGQAEEKKRDSGDDEDVFTEDK